MFWFVNSTEFLDVLILLDEWGQFVMTIFGYQLLNFNNSILFYKIYVAVVTLSGFTPFGMFSFIEGKQYPGF